VKRLFNLHTIGGWAGLGCFAYMIFFYLDTGVIFFLYISLPILLISILWIYAGTKGGKVT